MQGRLDEAVASWRRARARWGEVLPPADPLEHGSACPPTLSRLLEAVQAAREGRLHLPWCRRTPPLGCGGRLPYVQHPLLGRSIARVAPGVTFRIVRALGPNEAPLEVTVRGGRRRVLEPVAVGDQATSTGTGSWWKDGDQDDAQGGTDLLLEEAATVGVAGRFGINDPPIPADLTSNCRDLHDPLGNPIGYRGTAEEQLEDIGTRLGANAIRHPQGQDLYWGGLVPWEPGADILLVEAAYREGERTTSRLGYLVPVDPGEIRSRVTRQENVDKLAAFLRLLKDRGLKVVFRFLTGGGGHRPAGREHVVIYRARLSIPISSHPAHEARFPVVH